MAIEWGGWDATLQGIIGSVLTPPATQQPTYYAAPTQFPQQVSAGNDLTMVRGLGCKRRKRQRNILTQANIGIMWQISSLPNNANVRIALARAIR